MIARIAIASIAALTARAAVAHACGGDGDSGGSSSSGSSSSDSSSSSSDSGSSGVYVAPTCYETSDVHGYKSCSSFGAGWAIPEHLPALSLELATWSARVDFDDVDVGGTISHTLGNDYAYRVVSNDLGDEALAAGLKLRLLGHRGGFYAGIEGGVAGLGGDDHTRIMPATDDGMMTELTTSANTLLMAGAVVGVNHAMGRWSVGAELMAGGRGLVVEATSRRLACETTETHVAGRPMAEGRLRADVWLTPWITVGAYAGKDAVSGLTSGGLGVGGHLRAFDGGR